MLTIRADGRLTDDSVIPHAAIQPNRRRNWQSPAFVANYTPDMSLGDGIGMGSLAGAITVNGPIVGPNVAAGGALPDKIEVEFRWLQDGTGGRVVTYVGGGGGYTVGGAPAMITTANAVVIDLFQYDQASNVWRLQYRAQ